MNKKEVLEIKRRFKKEECTFTRMCGCYLNSSCAFDVSIANSSIYPVPISDFIV